MLEAFEVAEASVIDVGVDVAAEDVGVWEAPTQLLETAVG
jgi:hypothetical protein